MKVSVRFEGGAELADALQALPARVAKGMLKEALMDAGEPMQKSMRARAPRAPGMPDMADHIVISALTSSRDLSGDTFRPGPYQASVGVGPAKAFFYAYFQEWGTRRHGAQPFMRPAFDAHTQTALNILRDRLWTALASRGIQRSMTTSTGPVVAGPDGGGLL